MYGTQPSRVLIGEEGSDFVSCQENRKRQKIGDTYVDDRVRFQEIVDDSNLNQDATDPTYEITLYTDTQEYADSVAREERLQVEAEISQIEFKALRALIPLCIEALKGKSLTGKRADDLTELQGKLAEIEAKATSLRN